MNIPTILITLIIITIFLIIVIKGIINKKNGKGGCSCGCSDCVMADKCHPKK